MRSIGFRSTPLSRMTKKASRVLAVLLLLLALGFTGYALCHPEAAFPWSNGVTYGLYALYAAVIAVLFIAPFKKG